MLLILVLGGAGGGYWWYRQRASDGPVDYKTATVTRGDIVQQVTANGQISPVTNVLVGTQISGIIKSILADYNDRVTNGQVIAQIDPSTYDQNLRQGQAELASAKAGLELAQADHKRAKSLLEKSLIPESEFDKAVADLHQAEAAVQTKEASLRRTQVDLERTTITAPINGVVISRQVQPGQTVAASFNTPTLFTIANDLTQMRIEAAVSEADVGGVKEGQKVSFSVDAFPDSQFKGNVTQVRYEPVTVQNVVSYVTVVGVDNSSLKLRPGMTANARIVTAERTNTLRIANAALRFRPPEKALMKGGTNAVAKAAGTNAPSKGKKSYDIEGLPTPPWRAENRRPTEEERTKYMASLTPEQQQLYQKARAQYGSRGGGGGGEGSGEERRARSKDEGPVTRTLYLLDKEMVNGVEQPALKAVTVKTGISDGAFTEVLEGLNEGDVVVTGINQAAAAGAAGKAASASPFGGSPFGGSPGGGSFRGPGPR